MQAEGGASERLGVGGGCIVRPEGAALAVAKGNALERKGRNQLFKPCKGELKCHQRPLRSSLLFQSSPALGAGATMSRILFMLLVIVSILSPPWVGERPNMPDGRITLSGFQSSPAPRSGSDMIWHGVRNRQELFQSSPAPRSGSDQVWDSRMACRISFNPLPPLGAGATRLGRRSTVRYLFQSSPALGSGSDPPNLIPLRPALTVSILSRPWERERQSPVRRLPCARSVSILSRPWERERHR